LSETIRRRADIEVGAPWSASVAAPPEALWAAVAFDIEDVSAEDIQQAAETALADDKIILLAVAGTPWDTTLKVRELDCRTRRFGPLVERRVRNPSEYAMAAFEAVREAFTPITRIELGQGKTAVVRVRAGGLILEPNSPAHIETADVLLPILRTNDRYGKPMPGRISEIPWTLLQVTARSRDNPSVLNCSIHSGMRSPIRGRVSARRQRFAMLLRPAGECTDLVVEGRARQRDEVPPRLAGLEIYSKIPPVEPPQEKGPEEEQLEEKRNPPEFLGYTDWRGKLRIPPTKDGEMRLLYVKNGGQLLARLPIVPGASPMQLAQVPDDNPRLQAEGQIRGLSGEIMDLVAQRQILAIRIRKRIEEGKLDEAEDLLDDFRSLKTRSDMQKSLDQQRQRQLPSPYSSVQTRIDQLYGETRSMLGKYLDPVLAGQLTQELRQAR
jgi:hypothetical protein